MVKTVEILATEMAEAYAELTSTINRLTDAECSWEPVDGSWRVFRDSDGRWTYDYALPEPQPAPFTTIGWRLVHVAMCKVMYHEWAFGPRALTWDTIETPADVAVTIATLEDGHARLAGDLASLDDDDLERRVLTNWGEEWPAWRIFTTMTDHDRHHGAEIALLRDLHRIAGPFRV
jgi:DinB superfamily